MCGLYSRFLWKSSFEKTAKLQKNETSELLLNNDGKHGLERNALRDWRIYLRLPILNFQRFLFI